MKKIFLAVAMGALLMLTNFNSIAQAKQKKAAKPKAAATAPADKTATGDKAEPAKNVSNEETKDNKGMPGQDEMMKAWMEYATPSEMHKWMEEMNGTWEGTVLTWMDPSALPSKAKATNIQTSVLGGRYVVGNFTSDMMGQPFEGMSTMGYDNGRKVFVSTWIDNMGTGMVKMEGKFNAETKTLYLSGKQTDPISHKETDIREEMRMIDGDNYQMTMYGAGLDGKEMKFMEGTFTRKK